MSLPFPFTTGKSTVWIYRFIFYCVDYNLYQHYFMFECSHIWQWELIQDRFYALLMFSIVLWALPYILELPYFQVYLIIFSCPKCINSHFSKKPRSLRWRDGVNNYFQEAIPEQRDRKSTDIHIYTFLWVIWKSGVHTDNFILVQLQGSF